MRGLGEHMMARRYDKRMRRQETLQQIAFGAAAGMMFFGLAVLWILEVV